jgi:putative transposase
MASLARRLEPYASGSHSSLFACPTSAIKAPVGAPKARAHAERWVGSVRRECLDRLLIVGRRHLHHVLVTYILHHNQHRPHRALGQRAPLSDEQPLAHAIDLDRLRRRDLLGGLTHEYQLAA